MTTDMPVTSEEFEAKVQEVLKELPISDIKIDGGEFSHKNITLENVTQGVQIVRENNYVSKGKSYLDESPHLVYQQFKLFELTGGGWRRIFYFTIERDDKHHPNSYVGYMGFGQIDSLPQGVEFLIK